MNIQIVIEKTFKKAECPSNPPECLRMPSECLPNALTFRTQNLLGNAAKIPELRKPLAVRRVGTDAARLGTDAARRLGTDAARRLGTDAARLGTVGREEEEEKRSISSRFYGFSLNIILFWRKHRRTNGPVLALCGTECTPPGSKTAPFDPHRPRHVL